MLGGVESRTIPGPSVPFACKVCDALGHATTYQYGERATILPYVPVSPWTETNYVRCENCGELFVVRMSVFELPAYSPEQVQALVSRRVGLIPIALAMFGFLLFWAPGIGIVLNGIALLLNWRRRRHWTRIISLVGFALSVLALICIGVMLLIAVLMDN